MRHYAGMMMTPLLLLAALIPPPVPPALPVLPPSIVRTSRPGLLLDWNAGTATCDGVAQPVVLPAAPRPTTGYPGMADADRIAAFDFAIDATGRPHAIVRNRPASAYRFDSDDLVPAFAASRFAPGPERARCSVRFFRTGTPLADAPLQSLYAAGTPPLPGQDPALFQHLRIPGARCDPPRLEPLRIMVPSFRSILKIPGRPSWTAVRFDVDKSGRPIHAMTAAGSGNAALDVAARAAVAGSRFERGARTGCLWPYGHNAATLPAPPTPPGIDMSPPGSTCPANLPWADPLTLRFPENFRRRSIEGWAAIAYDVASWGQTGNIRVIAAEPAADFGEAAVRLIQTGRKPASSAGHIGCTVIVRYKMGDDTTPTIPEPPVDFQGMMTPA